MKNLTLRSAAALCIVFALLLPSCRKSARLHEDLTYLSMVFESEGYAATVYETGHPMLSSLLLDMESAMDDPPRKALTGYMFALDPEKGTPVIEVFAFEDAADARRLCRWLEGGEQFVKGESDLRIDGKTVYMGYLFALEIAEKTGENR